MPPLTFTEINSVPDILASNRHSLFLPSIPGVDVKALRISKVSLTLPQRSTGHSIVKLLGHSIGFRGNLSFDHLIQTTFYERSDGVILRSLLTWKNYVRNQFDGTSRFKAEYAQDGYFEVYSTTGSVVHNIRLINMFPVIVQYPEYGEESVPAAVMVQFNTDQVQLESGEQLSVTEFNNRFAGVS